MNTSLQILDSYLPVGSVESYIQRTQQIPMLSVEEEHALAKRFYEENDLNAARQLVMAHLRFVVKMARHYSGYGLAQADLISEGNIGLMKAVKRFDPYKGVRLVTFAVHWIKAEMHEFIIRNWRIVKIATTKAQRKLFFNLRSMKKRLAWFTAEEVADVASELKVSTAEVLEMERRLNASDLSFDLPVEHDEHDALPLAPVTYLEQNHADPLLLLEHDKDQQHYQTKMQQALATLDERTRDIIQQRWLADNKANLHELAAKYKISAERVRQIEEQALQKLQQEIVAA